MIKIDSCARCPSRARGPFKCLAAPQLDMLMRERSAREYAVGEIIFYEGNSALAVYCVGDGQIKLWRMGPHGDAHVLEIRGAGDLLGFPAVLTGGLHTVTAEALTRSRVCMIPRASFVEVVRDDAKFAFAALTHLATETNDAENRVMALSVEHVRQRTAGYLLGLLPEGTSDNSGPIELRELLPRHEIAQLIGTTPETLSRALRALERRGIIGRERDRIVVRDPEALRRAAG
jgi:CRP/FNR family transcriptional regulator